MVGLMAYNNIPSQKTASSTDATLAVLNGFDTAAPVHLNNQALVSLTGYLSERGFKNPSAETVAITILTQAKKDGFDPWTVIETVKSASNDTITGIVAEILNTNRFKTSSLGYVRVTTPVEDISRNILA
jgi:hypothetical protein